MGCCDDRDRTCLEDFTLCDGFGLAWPDVQPGFNCETPGAGAGG